MLFYFCDVQCYISNFFLIWTLSAPSPFLFSKPQLFISLSFCIFWFQFAYFLQCFNNFFPPMDFGLGLFFQFFKEYCQIIYLIYFQSLDGGTSCYNFFIDTAPVVPHICICCIVLYMLYCLDVFPNIYLLAQIFVCGFL